MPETKPPSVLLEVLLLVGLFAVGVVLALLGVSGAGVTIAAAWIGAAIVVGFSARRRRAGAVRRDPVATAAYPLQLPAERIHPDRVQLRFLPPTNKVYAPGLLCVAPGRVRFIPSRDRDDDRGFDSRADRVKLSRGIGRACLILITSDDRRARFVVNLYRKEVAAHLRAYLPIDPF
ncbi:MAG TPA: hypothetical protein VJM33_07685 [Microthrixaceae bacterium]|nr:hypothetical protein [Microthrixaceae bacterium]